MNNKVQKAVRANGLQNQKAVTALEMLTVAVIIGILASMAVGAYISQINNAKFAAARNEIRELELAAHRYAVDTGEFPPSSSGGLTTPFAPYFGNGNISQVLQRSASNNPAFPSSRSWQGPYMQGNEQRLVPIAVGTETQFMLLDPWGVPYHYVRGGEINPLTGIPQDYEDLGGTQYPADHLFFGIETYFNLRTFQIFSMGPDNTTFDVPSQGLDLDDITNFGDRTFTITNTTSGTISRRR